MSGSNVMAYAKTLDGPVKENTATLLFTDMTAHGTTRLIR